MPPRCIKCLTTLMPEATACPQCGRPAPPKSVLTQQLDMDKTQFVRISPGDLLPEDELPDEPPAASSPVPSRFARRRLLILAVLLGLLAGALLIFVLVSLSRARH